MTGGEQSVGHVVNAAYVIGRIGKTRRDTRVTANNRDNDTGCFAKIAIDLGNEGRCTDHIKGGHAEDPANET